MRSIFTSTCTVSPMSSAQRPHVGIDDPNGKKVFYLNLLGVVQRFPRQVFRQLWFARAIY